MKKFKFLFNGKTVLLPFIEALCGESHTVDVKKCLSNGVIHNNSGINHEIGSGYVATARETAPNGKYFYQALYMFVKGKQYPLPLNVQINDVEYFVLDHHCDWSDSLLDRGLLFVKKIAPLLVFRNVFVGDVLKSEALSKFNLPEFSHLGKPITVFNFKKMDFEAIQERVLEKEYHKVCDFPENDCELFYINSDSIEFWTCEQNKPVIYYDDELKTSSKQPFINISNEIGVEIVENSALEKFDENLFHAKVKNALLKDKIYNALKCSEQNKLDLSEYVVIGRIISPFTVYDCEVIKPNFNLNRFNLFFAIPQHVKDVMERARLPEFSKLMH